MADPNEIEALQASYRGALSTAAALAAWRDRVETLDRTSEPDHAALEELARISAAHAVASAALRGFVEAMLARRNGKPES